MEALYGLAAFFFAVGCIFLFLGQWSRDPKHLGTAVGKLAESKKVMRYPYRHSRKKIPFTASTYVYEVGGKTYRLRHDGRFGRNRLLKRVTVVYLKGFPRFGHLDTYPHGLHTMFGVIYLIFGLWVLLIPYL